AGASAVDGGQGAVGKGLEYQGVHASGRRVEEGHRFGYFARHVGHRLSDGSVVIGPARGQSRRAILHHGNQRHRRVVGKRADRTAVHILGVIYSAIGGIERVRDSGKRRQHGSQLSHGCRREVRQPQPRPIGEGWDQRGLAAAHGDGRNAVTRPGGWGLQGGGDRLRTAG